jgi:hypothetical protein
VAKNRPADQGENRKHRPWRIDDATTKDHSGRNAPAVAPLAPILIVRMCPAHLILIWLKVNRPDGYRVRVVPSGMRARCYEAPGSSTPGLAVALVARLC